MINTQGKLLISAFIIIILGITLIQPVADDIETAKDASITIANESVTISSGAGTLANDELISFTELRNSTVPSGIVTTQCNITLSSGGLICNTTDVTTTCYADYLYEPDTYVHSGAARTIITLTILFFALAILAVGVGYAVKSFKEGKIM